MSEEVNSVSFFGRLLLSRKANLSNSWRRVSLSSRSPPPPHFLRTNKLLLSHTHTLWQFPIFVIFTREARAQHLGFPHREKKKKAIWTPSSVSVRSLSQSVEDCENEEEGGRRRGIEGRAHHDFGKGEEKRRRVEIQKSASFSYGNSCVTRNVFSSRRRLN